MSDTPLTDEEEGVGLHFEMQSVVRAEFAKTLERENAELRRRLEEARERSAIDVVREAIEERDAMERNYHLLAQEMIYHGNSVQWWHSKANAYRTAIDNIWKELKLAGIYADGQKSAADGVRELAAAIRQLKGKQS